MVEATLCIPILGDPIEQVLLGLKKVGFGRGKYTGFGGKIEPGETIAASAARELAEETGIAVPFDGLHQVGYITFTFPARPEWDFGVHLFLVDRWQGQPTESDEMRPTWFPVSAIPYERMWDDGRYWLPHLIAGKRIRATFVFNPDNETVRQAHIESFQDK